MQRRSILEIPYPVARFSTCRPTFKLFACSCSSGVDQSTCSGCGGIVVCKHSRTRWKTARLHLSAATPRASSTSVIISFLFFSLLIFSFLLCFASGHHNLHPRKLLVPRNLPSRLQLHRLIDLRARSFLRGDYQTTWGWAKVFRKALVE